MIVRPRRIISQISLPGVQHEEKADHPVDRAARIASQTPFSFSLKVTFDCSPFMYFEASVPVGLCRKRRAWARRTCPLSLPQTAGRGKENVPCHSSCCGPQRLPGRSVTSSRLPGHDNVVVPPGHVPGAAVCFFPLLSSADRADSPPDSPRLHHCDAVSPDLIYRVRRPEDGPGSYSGIRSCPPGRPCPRSSGREAAFPVPTPMKPFSWLLVVLGRILVVLLCRGCSWYPCSRWKSDGDKAE